MKTVAIHIGPPKTGSTSIQAWLAGQRDALLEKRIYVQEELNFRSLYTFVRQPGIADSSNAISRLLEALRGSWKQYLLSCEFFCGFSSEEWLRLRELLSNQATTDVSFKILAYVRHPLKVLLSSRQEMLKKGGSLSSLTTGKLSLRYRNIHQRVSHAFDAEDILWRRYEEEPTFDVVYDFCKAVDLPVPAIQRERLNRSLTLEAALLLDRLNLMRADKRVAHPTLLRDLAGFGRTAFTVSEDELSKLQEAVRAELTWIHQRFGIAFPEFRPIGYSESYAISTLTSPESQALLARYASE